MILEQRIILPFYYYVNLLLSVLISMTIAEYSNERMLIWVLLTATLHVFTRSERRYMSLLSVMFLYHFPSIGFFLEMMPILGKRFVDELAGVLVAMNNPFVSYFVKPFSHFNLEFVGESQAHSLNSVHVDQEDIEEIRAEAHSIVLASNRILMLILSLTSGLLLCILTNNIILMTLIIVFIILLSFPNERRERQCEHEQVFNGPDGVYRIKSFFLGFQSQAGVAYVKNGVIQSRLQVTGETTIYHFGQAYRPTFCDGNLDIISWCGHPTYITPLENQEVIVELLPCDSQSTMVYKTIAHSLPGKIFFKGIQASRETIGSPYFIRNEIANDNDFDTVAPQFAGNIGTHLSTQDQEMDTWQVELLENSHNLLPLEERTIQPGHHRQIFSYSGSGKTTIQIPQIILDGLNISPIIVIVTPTQTAAEELYDIIVNNLNTLSVTLVDGSHGQLLLKSQVLVVTYTSLLTMLLDSVPFPSSTGFIIDDAHIQKTKMLVLLSLLRHRILTSQQGFLLELALSGYHLQRQHHIMDLQSNHSIQNRTFNSTQFPINVSQIVKHHQRDRIIVFCPNLTGASGVNAVVWKLKTDYPHLNIIPLQKKNFKRSVKTIQDTIDHYGVIIVTVNHPHFKLNCNLDVCIDSAKQMRTLKTHNRMKIFQRRETTFSQFQFVQRRSNVGRVKKGLYYYPDHILFEQLTPDLMSNEAEMFDLKVFEKSFNINQTEQQSEQDLAIPLHIATLWLTANPDKISNPILFNTIFISYGYKISQYEAKNALRSLSREQHCITIRRKKMAKIKVSFWDDRDRSLLILISKAKPPEYNYNLDALLDYISNHSSINDNPNTYY